MTPEPKRERRAEEHGVRIPRHGCMPRVLDGGDGSIGIAAWSRCDRVRKVTARRGCDGQVGLEAAGFAGEADTDPRTSYRRGILQQPIG